MSKTIIVVGFIPGVSTGVAERFGAEGFNVALVARTKARLDQGVQSLKTKGINAAAYVADAGNPAAISAAIASAREQLGSVEVLHWNAFGGTEPIDLVATDPILVRNVFDVAVTGLLAAVQEALPDLRAAQGALLVTNGAFGDISPQMDQFAVALNAQAVALGNAAKDKLVGLLAARLQPDGVYVGEVIIAGGVKGTSTGVGQGIHPATVAEVFWALYQARQDVRRRVS